MAAAVPTKAQAAKACRDLKAAESDMARLKTYKRMDQSMRSRYNRMRDLHFESERILTAFFSGKPYTAPAAEEPMDDNLPF